MITVYHLRRSRSERVLWLLEELGLEYEIVAFDRDAQSRAPAAMREIHPLGKSPVLGDGELVLAESGAIVDYLVTRYGRGRLAPSHDDPAWPRYVFWLHFAEGSLMPWLVMDLLVTSGIVPGVDPGPLAPMLAQEIARTVQWIDDEFEGREFAAGDVFSAADVMLTFALQTAKGRGALEGTRNLVPYLERMTARDAYLRAERKAA
jgi:glutathione S-transferase